MMQFGHDPQAKPKQKLEITFKVPCQVEKREGWWISRCELFDVTTQGETKEKALINLEDALFFFFESCIRRGTFFKILSQAGIRSAPPVEQPRRTSGLIDRMTTAWSDLVGAREPLDDDSVDVSVPMAFMIPAGAQDDHPA